jgi:hypothetical protein
MHVASRVCAGIATLALAGSATLAAVPAANAATEACGSNCVALVAEDWGPGYVTAYAGLDARARHITLAAAGQYADEDFQRDYVATVATLYADGLVSGAVGHAWLTDDAYEYQYIPDGTSTNLCLGTATTATQGATVSLEPCGVDATTIWIAMSGDTQAGYEPLINGTDTNISTPYVLTCGAVGDTLTTTELFMINHFLSSTQMWQNKFGVL